MTILKLAVNDSKHVLYYSDRISHLLSNHLSRSNSYNDCYEKCLSKKPANEKMKKDEKDEKDEGKRERSISY